MGFISGPCSIGDKRLINIDVEDWPPSNQERGEIGLDIEVDFISSEISSRKASLSMLLKCKASTLL